MVERYKVSMKVLKIKKTKRIKWRSIVRFFRVTIILPCRAYSGYKHNLNEKQGLGYKKKLMQKMCIKNQNFITLAAMLSLWISSDT